MKPARTEPLRVREYGPPGFPVVVVHGGPGTPGYMAPLARRLADPYRVFEPLQRGSGVEPLTVARHVEDLHEVVESHCRGTRPALVGHSWGAMLALAYAAAHPRGAVAIALIGCGTFDPASRERLQAIREERMSAVLRRRIERLPVQMPDPDKRLRAMGALTLRLYSYKLFSAEQKVEQYDARAHQESWEDMMRLQAGGVYPAAFSATKLPVIMLHGAADPHPGAMIRASLEPHLPQLEYREWERCGHFPWLEKEVHDEFVSVLHQWLARQCGRGDRRS